MREKSTVKALANIRRRSVVAVRVCELACLVFLTITFDRSVKCVLTDLLCVLATAEQTPNPGNCLPVGVAVRNR